MRRPGLFPAAFALFALAAVASAEPPARAVSLGEIRKEHNVDLGSGRYALRLTVPADFAGMKGETVGVDVWFADEQGNLLRSVQSAYADAAGNLHVASRPAAVEKDVEGLDFVFLIPYGAFPCGAKGRYPVEARAVLSLRPAAPSPTPTTLGTKTTTFFVEG